MKPNTLSLAGFRGIRDGLGREAVTIEIPDAPLVALVGPNGIGKSTILDNLQPFRFMPSRAGEANPKAFSFYDHVGALAEKDLQWTHRGQDYRSILKFKQSAKTRKTEATLLVRNNGDWEPASHNGILSDGRSDTYDRLLVEILGSPALYCATAFFAQNRKTLSSYKATDIKLLLSELLHLGDFLEQAKQAKAVGDAMRAHLPSLRSQVVSHEANVEEYHRLASELQTAQAGARDAQRDIERLRLEVQTATRDLAESQAEDSQHAAVKLRRLELNEALENTRTERTAEVCTLTEQTTELRQRLLTQEQTFKREVTRLEHDSQQLTQEIKERSDQINRLEQSAAGLEQQQQDNKRHVAGLKQQAETCAATEQTRVKLEHRGKLLEQQLSEARSAGIRLRQTVENVRTRAALCGRVPCQGTDLQGRCELLADSMTAAGELPVHEHELKGAQDAYRETDKRRQDVHRQLEALPPPPPSLAKDLLAAESEQERLNRLAVEYARLPTMREVVGELQKRLEDTTNARNTLDAQHHAAQAQLSADINRLVAQRNDTDARWQARIEKIEQEIAKLPPEQESERVNHALKRYNEAESALHDAESRKEVATNLISQHKAAADQLKQKIDTEAATVARIHSLESEIAHWDNLRRGLGKDGVVALCIDDAGPAIAGIANDLLESCFGGDFQVELLTQTEKADGNLREDFEIIVHGAEGPRPLRVMSGGQRVYLNEVLSTAIGLYEARHSRGRYHTRLADEVDGALDPERKLKFARLKRRALELAGFEQEIFISHSPEIRDSADATIDLVTLKM